MKIAIIGAGAMGCLYGGKLSAADNEVWLLDIMQDHIDAVKENGLIMEEKTGDGDFAEVVFDSLNATTNPSKAGQVDLAIIFVKSTVTASAIDSNKSVFGPQTIALTLQNGLGNIEAIGLGIGADRIIAGTTAHGATMLGNGRIRHAGIGKTVIGELDGNESDRIKKIIEVFNQAGLETELSHNVLGLLWDKLLVNVGINALTALSGLQNGKLLEYPELTEILELAVLEAKKVAEAKGIELNFKDPVQHAKDVCVATSENRSSMLQDILNKRRTEIDMINGAIVREGSALGLPSPVNAVLTNLVKVKQLSGG